MHEVLPIKCTKRDCQKALDRRNISTTMSSITVPKKLHVAVFPWLAFGHIIPFLEVAKHIARRGHKVSFISTPRNIQRLPKIPPNFAPLIDLVQIPLPSAQNLPENAEATMDVPYHIIPYLKIAHDGLEQGIDNFLQTHNPDWIIHDFAPHWLPPIASNLGISRAHYSVFNASFLCFFGATAPEQKHRYGVRTLPEQFTVPPEWIPFPSNLVFKPYEAKQMFDVVQENASGITDWSRAEATIQGCQVYLIRSCREIEGEWLDLLQHLNQKLVVPAGLLPVPVEAGGDDKEEDSSWSRIGQWLDKQEKGTVVYIALGSEVNLSRKELTELALGLELSSLPFIWVLRRPSGVLDSDEWLKLPDGFVDRIKTRGLVWTSWAPQRKILAHESIGGFVTHCGWSSIIEGVQFGRPAIMLPFLHDQGLVARFWDKKIGIEVPRKEEDGSFTRKVLADTVRLVVVDEKGKGYREGSKEHGALFSDKELHDGYMDRCVEYLENHVHT